MHFILVAGSCLGGWVWQRVLQRLLHANHQVTCVSLTGLAERQHLYASNISYETHVADIQSAIDFSGQQNVVLVGHSFAGLLISSVAALMPARIERLVYVDAILPISGESWASHHPTDIVQKRLAGAKQSGKNALMPVDASTYGLTGIEREWVNRWQTPHPLHYYQELIHFDEDVLRDLPTQFIDCNKPAASAIAKSRKRAKQHHLDYALLQTGHLPMVSHPHGLTKLLVGMR
jgi:pimeloyl-ACP methyl ester carboxylesterase